MGSFNRITIVGYLGREPETRYTPNGDAVCSFSIATTERRKDEEITSWFNVSVWGKSAEACQKYLNKGSQVYIEGRLTLRPYQKKDGTEGTSADVRASEVQFLGSKGEDTEQPTASAAAVAAQAPAKPQGKPKQVVIDDSSIPF